MATTTEPTAASISEWLGDDAEDLLGHTCETIDKSVLHLPGPDFIDRVMIDTDRSISTLRNLRARCSTTAALAGTGYLSILPVDQGIEHSAGRELRPQPGLLRPGEHRRTGHRRRLQRGRLDHRRARRRRRADTRTGSRSSSRSTTTSCSPIRTSSTRCCSAASSGRGRWGHAASGATIYFGSEQSTRQIREVSAAFEEAHSLGMSTVLWCYLRNPAFKQADKDYHLSADLTGQANHLGVTIQADIIKQKLPENNNGYGA